MRFVLASGNAHKAGEITAELPDQFDITLQSSLGVSSVAETGLTFIENALIKARHASKETKLPAIADDSGICVNALNGEPGLYSARFAGETASDLDNVELLLERMSGVSDRRAHFVCSLVCLEHPQDPSPLIAEARWYGEVTTSIQGNGGFGYDPVFYVPSEGMTVAEMPAEKKNKLSHRGQALAQLTKLLLEKYTA